MDWRGRRQSRNVEDRRGSRRSGGMITGGAGVIVVLLLGAFFGVDVTPLLQGADPAPSSRPAELSPEDRAAGEFVSVVLADTETIWTEIFASQLGRAYSPPVLVLFTQATSSPCGGASGATGPFYCPGDNRIYLDTAFFATLERRLGAGGDFAAAYVVAHEVAHHVQDELGILDEVNALRARATEADSNALSVRIELQADCLAGIWARAAQARLGVVEPGDFDEALNAARQIGDDTLQRNAGQRPMPHTFTHGTSDQRERWFRIGLDSGQVRDCDTFAARRL